MSINNKVAVLLEEKIWHIKECKPSDELTKMFMNVLDLLTESTQIIIKMRYGLYPDGGNYKWQHILDVINALYSDYPANMHRINMHRIKERERKAWVKINQSMQISEFDIACNNLLNFINENP